MTPLKMQKTVLMLLILSATLAAALVAGFLYLNRPQLVRIEATLPADFPADGFSHAALERLLGKYVDEDGNVAYAAWHADPVDRQALDAYLSAVAAYSPDNAPERFATRPDRLAYWLYAYNAAVIHGVLQHWPLKSVTDVKAPIEAVTGLGFFYRQRFLFGGEALSLYEVEHRKILDTYRDPRVHFVLNCASESCPVLRPELPTGDELEALLSTATRDFISDPRNVHIDHEKETVELSTIFKWYRKDFVNEVRRLGLPADNGVLDYIAHAVPAMRSDVERAAAYKRNFRDYNWDLNDAARH